MKKDIEEHDFKSDARAEKYRELRAEGWAPDRAALKVLRDAYKQKKSTVKTLENQCDKLKERAEEITGGEDFTILEKNHDGKGASAERFRYQPYSGCGIKNKDEFRDKWSDVFDEFVYTYEGESARFD